MGNGKTDSNSVLIGTVLPAKLLKRACKCFHIAAATITDTPARVTTYFKPLFRVFNNSKAARKTGSVIASCLACHASKPEASVNPAYTAQRQGLRFIPASNDFKKNRTARK